MRLYIELEAGNMKTAILKNLKLILIVMIATFLVVFILTSSLKYRMPQNKVGKIDLPYEEGSLINRNEVQFDQRSEYEVVAPSVSNNQTKLTIDLNTTNVIVHQNGVKYSTMPYDIYGENMTDEMRSPLKISYFYKGRNTPVQLGSYNESIKDGHYEVYQLSNGVRVVYEIGVREVKSSWIPNSIRQEEYYQIMANATEEEQQALRQSYSGSADDIIIRLNNSVSQQNLQILYSLWWDKLGMTIDELARRAKELTGSPSFVEMPLFKIPVDYKIDHDGNFIVEVLNDKIEENGPDLGEKTLRIKNITVLENFLIMPKNSATEDDFFFIPDGSGAIVKPYYLDQTAQYYKPFYNNNRYFKKNQGVVDLSESITLNAYGLGKGDKGVLAVIEQGAGVARLNMPMITANARLSADFDLRVDDEYEFVKGVKINQFDDLIRDERIRVKYLLLKKDNPITYFDMVESLQNNYLKDLTKLDIYKPIEVEMIGSILERRHFVGIPYFKTIGLTRYEDVLKIYDELKGLNVTYKYSGFSRGGVNGYRQTNIQPDGALGNMQQLLELNQKIDDLYFDIYVLNKYYNNDGSFKNSSHGLKGIGGKSSVYYETNRMTLLEDKNELFRYYVLDPNYLENELSKITNEISKFNAISLRDIGNTFVSSYTLNPFGFENSANIMELGVQAIKENQNIMLSNPFLQFAKYANTIENLPLTSSGHVNFYSDIPFLQLLYAPYVNSYSKVVNLGDDIEMSLLKSLVSQSGLKYVLTYNDSSLTKTTPYYNKYYATNYQKHLDGIKTNHDQLLAFNQENQTIISHKLILPSIYLVKYDNGNEFVFNLSNDSIDYLTNTIPKRSYLKVN